MGSGREGRGRTRGTTKVVIGVEQGGRLVQKDEQHMTGKRTGWRCTICRCTTSIRCKLGGTNALDLC